MTETGLTLEATQALDAFLRSLPLSALAQTLSPSETITPQALAAAGLEARDDATFAPKTFASETIAAPAAHPSPSGARSLSSHADVALSDVSAAAATWTLPTLSIIEEAQLHGDLSDEAIASLKPDLALQETLGQGGMGVVKGAAVRPRQGRGGEDAAPRRVGRGQGPRAAARGPRDGAA